MFFSFKKWSVYRQVVGPSLIGLGPFKQDLRFNHLDKKNMLERGDPTKSEQLGFLTNISY